MVSIIEHKGFQFKVNEGDTISVPLIQGEEGTEITIDKVLLVSTDSSVKVGTPVVEGASVTAKILGQIKGPKVTIMKKKRRKDYKIKTGHRQKYTQIQITSISA